MKAFSLNLNWTHSQHEQTPFGNAWNSFSNHLKGDLSRIAASVIDGCRPRTTDTVFAEFERQHELAQVQTPSIFAQVEVYLFPTIMNRYWLWTAHTPCQKLLRMSQLYSVSNPVTNDKLIR